MLPATRAHIHQPGTVGEHAADWSAALIGSWPFLIVQATILATWIVVNTVASFAWDRPPYILLNLMLSFQAAFTGPVLLIASNRAASRDRARDDLEAAEVQQMAGMQQDILDINKEQIEILRLLRQLVKEEPQ